MPINKFIILVTVPTIKIKSIFYYNSLLIKLTIFS